MLKYCYRSAWKPSTAENSGCRFSGCHTTFKSTECAHVRLSVGSPHCCYPYNRIIQVLLSRLLDAWLQLFQTEVICHTASLFLLQTAQDDEASLLQHGARSSLLSSKCFTYRGNEPLKAQKRHTHISQKGTHKCKQKQSMVNKTHWWSRDHLSLCRLSWSPLLDRERHLTLSVFLVY